MFARGRSLAGFRTALVGALTAALLAVAVIVLPATGLAQEEVSFADPNLEAAVRAAIGKPTGEILVSDVAGLAVLDARWRGISNLDGIEHLTQLTWLYLGENQISDLTPLSGLTQLTDLGLGYNQISDLTPLSGLTQLTDLYLRGNQISGLTPLSGLTQLMELRLEENQISDLTPLSGLTQLTLLGLADSQISDLTPLSSLTQLGELYLGNNQISDLTPLSGLTQLWLLDLGDNPLNDEAYDIHIPALEARGVWVSFDPETGLSEGQEGGALPSAYALYPNAPNPFNPTTSIAYDLPEGAEVSLTICNGLGQQVAELVSARQEAGQHTVSWNAQGCASGTYFYRLAAGSFSQTRRMILLK